MDTEDVTRKCDSCKEQVSIDATKCPHCRSTQWTSRSAIAITTILGLIGLPFTYTGTSVAIERGIPNGAAEGIVTGLPLGIAVIGPLFLLVALGAYIQRKEAIDEAKKSS